VGTVVEVRLFVEVPLEVDVDVAVPVDVIVNVGVPVFVEVDDRVPVFVEVDDRVPVYEAVDVLLVVMLPEYDVDNVELGVAGRAVPLTEAASFPTVMSTPHACGSVRVAE
jgi:hypothetical protein